MVSKVSKTNIKIIFIENYKKVYENKSNFDLTRIEIYVSLKARNGLRSY